jgi:hypothetical protein
MSELGLRRPSASVFASPVTWVVLATAIAVAALVRDAGTDRVATEPPPASGFYEGNDAELVRAASEAPFVERWTFDTEQLPEGWKDLGRSRVRPIGGGMSVLTSQLPQGYQLESPVRTLDPGSYEAIVNGRVRVGGMTVGVVDASRDRWLGTGNFWSGQQFDGRAMGVAFRIFEPTPVRIILANWAPGAYSSSWLVSAIGLRARVEERAPVKPAQATEAEAAFYRTGETPVDAPRGADTPPQLWDFSTGAPQGWNIYNGAIAEPYAGGTVVRTAPTAADWQVSGPPLELDAGSYALVVEGRILGGGLQLGALNSSDSTWVDTARFWSGQMKGEENAQLALWFNLPAATRVQPIIANWAPAPSNSIWTIRTIRLERDPRATVLESRLDSEPLQASERADYGKGATAIATGMPSASFIVEWRFTAPWWRNVSIPSGWRPLGRARIEARADATLVLAPKDGPGPQLQSVGPVVEPGRYRVSVDGRVLAGGLELQAVDGGTGRVLARNRYWSGQRWKAGATMELEVPVRRRTTLMVTFATWQSRPRASAWSLRRVTLTRLPAP